MNKKSVLLASMLMAGGAVFAQKLSPSTNMLLMQRAQGLNVNTKSMATVNEDETFDAYVKINSQAVLKQIEALGGKVRTNMGGNLVTVALPVAKIQEIANLDDVTYIQAAPKVRLLMDNARADANVDQCHTATTGMEAYTGKGVVVGLVDTGMQYTHIDYFDTEGTECRIRRVWNQGKAGTAPSGYDYGAEYATASRIKSQRYDVTTQYHAGHVLGIAAGADKSAGYYGVAPDADIVFVSMGDDVSEVVDGVKYIFDYAKSVGKPCVVNLSLGTHSGPHDGTSETDQMFDKLVSPGYIIVGAAGNEGEDNLHVGKTLESADDAFKFMTNNPYSSTLGIDLWGSKDSHMAFKAVLVNARSGQIMAESDTISTDETVDQKTISLKTGSTSCTVYYSCGIADNGKPEAFIMTYGTGSNTYKLGFVVVGEEGSTFHAWQVAQYDSFASTSLNGWTSADNDYSVGEIGGTGKNVISVGSYNTRLKWEDLSGRSYDYTQYAGDMGDLSLFSSHGPTADGRRKPDVTAPGAEIVSAMSSFYYGFSSTTCVAKTTVGSATHYYQTAQGTSMASPFVTGSVALWLQANPKLTVDDIREVIEATSRKDEHTGETASNLWGAGKIDTYAGLKYILEKSSTGISEQGVTEGMFQVVGDHNAHAAKIYFEENGTPVRLSVYNALGQQLSEQTLTANGTQVDLSSYGTGVYVFKMQRGAASKSVKMTL